MSNSETELGKPPLILNERDAIHIACIAMVADCKLQPGEHIGLSGIGTASNESLPFVGIVDPFLKIDLSKGDKFWLILYPKTVTSIKHHWTHPLFGNQEILIEDPKRWIERFAAQWHYSYDEFMNGALNYIDNDREMDDNDFNYSLEIDPKDWDTFWKYFELLTGNGIKNKDKEFLRCCPN